MEWILDRLRALNAELVARLDAVLAVEGEYANNKGDCSCIFRSRNLEREYETGNCPHQKARAVIAKAKG